MHSPAIRRRLLKDCQSAAPHFPWHSAIESLEPRMLLAAGPIGSEFVPTATLDGWRQQPAVAMNRDGDFVVAWVNYNIPDGTNDIYARRFNAAGEPLGPDLRISITPTYKPGLGHQDHVAVAIDEHDNFVVVWNSLTSRESWQDVYARRYDAKSNELGPVFRVNKTTANWQQVPDIAMDPSGNFTVVWQSGGQGADNCDIYAQRFDASTRPVGPEFRVNSSVTGSQFHPAIAMDATGNFAITWGSLNDYTDYTDYDGVYVQRFNAAGQAQGQEIQVATTTSLGYPDIAMADDGQSVIVWDAPESYGQYGIYAQQFNALGLSQGDRFRVDTCMRDYQFDPAVAMNAKGGFVVTWYRGWNAGSDLGVYLRQYDANGIAQGSELRTSANVREYEQHPAIAMDAKGNFLVAWDTTLPDVAHSIRARRYAIPDHPASVSGRAWRDVNANGIQDANEVGFDGIQVDLYTQSGLLVASTTTTDNGIYQFTGLVPDQQYYIQVTPAEGSVLSRGNLGEDDTLDSDVNRKTKQSSLFTFTRHAMHQTLDAGLVPKARIIGVVFHDENENALRDANEAGLSGWIVYLDADNDGQLDQDELSATSDTNGRYLLDDIQPGNYVLRQVPHGLWTVAPPLTVSISLGQSIPNLDLPNRAFPSSAELTPLGPEFTLRTHPSSSPMGEMSLAVDPQGGFVMAWSDLGTDGTGWNVYAQCFAADGTPKAGPFLVPSTIANSEYAPDIAMDSQGNFVVVWEGDDHRNGQAAYGRRFDANGTPLSNEFRISPPNIWAESPMIVMNPNGSFVVAFGGEDGIQVQRYDATGIPKGTFVQVSTQAQQFCHLPDIAMDAAGNFVITWIANGTTYEERFAYARRFDPAGRPLTDPFRVNTFSAGEDKDPSIGMDALGNFVISWTHCDWDPVLQTLSSIETVYARHFAADGTPLTGLFSPGLGTARQSEPKVTTTPTGEFLLSWCEGGNGPRAQLYGAAGVPLGSAFSLPQKILGYTQTPRLAANTTGKIVAIWAHEGQLPSIQARFFTLTNDNILITGSAGADTYFLTRDADEIRLYTGTNATGTPLTTLPSDSMNSLTILGLTDNDSLLIDFSNGDPIPPRGLFFDGGKGNDAIILLGTDDTTKLSVSPDRIFFNSSRITPANIEALSFGATPNKQILLDSLTIDGPARLRLPAGNHVLATNSLAIRNGGMLDLIDGNLVLHATEQTRDQLLADTLALLRTGRSSGATFWQGPGLASFGARTNRQTGLFAALNDQGDATPLLATLHDLPLSPTDILVLYALNGDTNLDGAITDEDYEHIDTGYLLGTTGYRNGDLNYDNLIDAADYFLIDSAYITQPNSTSDTPTTPPSDSAPAASPRPSTPALAPRRPDTPVWAPSPSDSILR